MPHSLLQAWVIPRNPCFGLYKMTAKEQTSGNSFRTASQADFTITVLSASNGDCEYVSILDCILSGCRGDEFRSVWRALLWHVFLDMPGAFRKESCSCPALYGLAHCTDSAGE